MPSTVPTPEPVGSPLTAALVKFHEDVATIHETSQANFGLYADLKTVLSVVLPALSKNKIRLSQSFEPWGEDGTATVLVTSLKHISGEEQTSRLPLLRAGSNTRNPLHDWGGIVTYQRRYALLAILGLEAGITDDDGDSFTQEASASSAQPTASPVAKPAPVKASNGVKPAELPPPPSSGRLTPDQRKALIASMNALPKQPLNAAIDAFRQQFKIAKDQKIADYITTTEHADFLNLHLTNAAGVN